MVRGLEKISFQHEKGDVILSIVPPPSTIWNVSFLRAYPWNPLRYLGASWDDRWGLWNPSFHLSIFPSFHLSIFPSFFLPCSSESAWLKSDRSDESRFLTSTRTKKSYTDWRTLCQCWVWDLLIKVSYSESRLRAGRNWAFDYICMCRCGVMWEEMCCDMGGDVLWCGRKCAASDWCKLRYLDPILVCAVAQSQFMFGY